MNPDAFHIPLVIAAVAFAFFMAWRFRPAFVDRPEVPVPEGVLRQFQERIHAATTDAERASALCDAGDACAMRLGRRAGAVGFYLRAMRAHPTSPEIIERAARGLARRPRALENLLWRRLGASAWDGENRAAARCAASHLARLYAGPLRSATRARAMEHAEALLAG